MRSVREAARAVRAREVSPAELTEAALDAIDGWEPHLNVFSQVHAGEALDEAGERADAVARGDELGPLHGVPVAVKDLFDVAGWPTTGCSQAYRGYAARQDAAVVRRLREAGAVVVGKTNQHELAAGGTNAVSACGLTKNPWDITRLTGGSSGGSAAAAAARIVPATLGTDTGGSVRIPASFCGVAGLKPTFGRVEMDGAMPLAASLDTIGPFAPEVADVALVFAVLAGEGPDFLEAAAGPIAGFQVGMLTGFFAERVHPEVAQAVQEVRRALEAGGASARDVDVGDVGDSPQVWDRIAWTEFASAHGLLLRRPETLYARTREVLEYGSRLAAVEFFRAEERAAQITGAFAEALADVDLLLAPATPFPAPRPDAKVVEVGRGEPHEVHRGGPAWFTRIVNLTGLAALSVPAGFSVEGLPLGVQLIGRDEAVLLRAGAAVQSVTGHHERAPARPSP